MRKIGLLLSALLCMISSAWADAQFAVQKDAEQMVVKVVAAIKASRDQTLAEITDKNPKWIDRDLYPTVMTLKGVVLAHGQNPKMVDKDLIDFKDPDGKLFYQERMEMAASKGKFWQDYKFTDPLTKKVLPKTAYCEKTGEMVVCAGVYKR